ncbi:MAG TPA: acetyl-CoA C-acyltransferase [Aggregatilineales bacterium]|nr:acetyl-CoA C-acyltransferase [Anaerolineales bacterium]HRE46903.1 acetyl-CoA C-acyltransferase [Aggregatilineales bacterium]
MPTNGQHEKHGTDIVILGGARTPHGKFLGALKPYKAVDLGKAAIQAAVERSHIDPAEVDEVIMGQVVPAGAGQAVARQMWIGAGYPDRVGGLAVNKACGSGLKAIMLAANALKAQDGSLYVAGGAESMSNAPYLDFSTRTGARYGHVELKDSLQHDGLWCSLQNWLMGNAAEFIANQLEVTREEMDAFAYESHQKAARASEGGAFQAEITPLVMADKKGETRITSDEPIRGETTVEALGKLKPAFEANGRVTAGNAPGLNDGASAVVVSTRAYAETKGITPLARIVGYGQAALDPQWLFYAPVKAIPIALQRAGWTMAEVDLFEINEAFAAQVLADVRGLEREGYTLPMEKLNVNGGAIALGHPVGASGARVLVTLIHALKARGLKRGIAALCLGGAEAVAMAVEID